MHDAGDAEVQVVHPPVDEVEDLSARPAVELGFDSLRVRVWGELLAGFLVDQKQSAVLRVGDPELLGAQRADLFCGGVRVDDQRFGRAAHPRLLQRDPEIVLERKEFNFRKLSNERKGHF